MQTALLTNARHAGGLSKYHCSVNKACGHAVFEKSGKVLKGCANLTMIWNTQDVIYLTDQSGEATCLVVIG